MKRGVTRMNWLKLLPMPLMALIPASVPFHEGHAVVMDSIDIAIVNLRPFAGLKKTKVARTRELQEECVLPCRIRSCRKE